MKKAFECLATLVLVVVILICAGLFIAPRFGWHLDIVRGGSMEPTIKVGSLIVIRPVQPQDVEIDDVITYRGSTDSATVTTHRVIGVKGSDKSLTFLTKGDANEDPDAYTVAPENVLGRVLLNVPYVGYAMAYIRTPLGMGLLIGIPVLIIIVMELRNIWQAVAEKKIEGRYRTK